MRFRFCGDLDCPDWVLAEISTLAKISSVKLKLICAQVLKEQLGEAVDYEKILKLTADARFESGDIKATVAVLCFILSSAAKHNVSGDNLSSELQQLGLPRANCLTRNAERKQPPLITLIFPELASRPDPQLQYTTGGERAGCPSKHVCERFCCLQTYQRNYVCQ
ncbi:COMM domain-containing protein 4 isoform X3 [Rhinoderma darwinii]|uniref:COMM domain-containing protein 4 isoform X3 n=1 Tax=Rhinoderma darwinii TaxID=43563 RepID=UPI003F67B1B4